MLGKIYFTELADEDFVVPYITRSVLEEPVDRNRGFSCGYKPNRCVRIAQSVPSNRYGS